MVGLIQNTLRGQTAEIFYIKAGGIYVYHGALQD
jgi:hypothetical protein